VTLSGAGALCVQPGPTREGRSRRAAPRFGPAEHCCCQAESLKLRVPSSGRQDELDPTGHTSGCKHICFEKCVHRKLHVQNSQFSSSRMPSKVQRFLKDFPYSILRIRGQCCRHVLLQSFQPKSLSRILNCIGLNYAHFSRMVCVLTAGSFLHSFQDFRWQCVHRAAHGLSVPEEFNLKFQLTLRTGARLSSADAVVTNLSVLIHRQPLLVSGLGDFSDSCLLLCASGARKFWPRQTRAIFFSCALLARAKPLPGRQPGNVQNWRVPAKSGSSGGGILLFFVKQLYSAQYIPTQIPRGC
jgi:hypothetical protein